MGRRFKFVVAFEVDEVWVADGFDIRTTAQARGLIESRLGWAYGHEYDARVVAAPSHDEVLTTQGYVDPAEREAKRIALSHQMECDGDPTPAVTRSFDPDSAEDEETVLAQLRAAEESRKAAGASLGALAGGLADSLAELEVALRGDAPAIEAISPQGEEILEELGDEAVSTDADGQEWLEDE